jgi:NADH-quinone oxidoreductase subunit B
MGACATSGGIFDNYAIVQGVDKVVPVDVYIPGCPPRPEMLIHAVMMLQQKVSKESVRDRKDVFIDQAREAVPPGTLPASGVSIMSEAPGETESRPYTIPSRHERRKST